MKSGETVSLEVTVCGSPELKTTWFKGNKELSANAKYHLSFKKQLATLKILSADKADAGEYTLQVTNHVGTSSCKIKLTVSGLCFLCRFVSLSSSCLLLFISNQLSMLLFLYNR